MLLSFLTTNLKLNFPPKNTFNSSISLNETRYDHLAWWYHPPVYRAPSIFHKFLVDTALYATIHTAKLYILTLAPNLAQSQNHYYYFLVSIRVNPKRCNIVSTFCHITPSSTLWAPQQIFSWRCESV
jgi:hypothetical protein